MCCFGSMDEGVMFRFLTTSFVFFLRFYSESTFCCAFKTKKKNNPGNLFLNQHFWRAQTMRSAASENMEFHESAHIRLEFVGCLALGNPVFL